jgi:Domain of unknown function (DUF222)
MYDAKDPAAASAGSLRAVDLLDRIVACERRVAAAQAEQLALIAQFARGRPGLLGERLQVGASEFAVDELAAELRLSRTAAGARLVLAVALSERLPGTAAALLAGEVDLPKVRAVADATDALGAPLALAVEQRVLPKAARQTVGQLRAALTRAVLAVDPHRAQLRHDQAVLERRVAVTALPDGMAELWALLPAPAASAVYTAIDRHARRPGHPADVPMDARRADALLELITGPAVPTEAASAVPLSEAAPATTPEPDTDTSADDADDAAGSSTSAARGLPSVEDAEQATAGGDVRDTGDASATRPRLAPLVQVTVAATTLLGLDDQPGELAGHGPVPAEVARQLAADPSGTWRRILTDPATGTIIDVGHRGYRPPPRLARFVAARDGTCRFPGCRQPARRCDLDHVQPWPDGPTNATNMIALCRHHHRLKHSGRWQVMAARDGTVSWTAPTNRTYITTPPPVTDPDNQPGSTGPSGRPPPAAAGADPS